MTPEVESVLVHELLGDEGEKLRVYDDATSKLIVPGSHVIGNPSIGIGRNLAGRGITQAESRYLLNNDISDAEKQLLGALPWVAMLSPNRQCAMYSLYFNTSLGGNVNHFVAKWPKFILQMKSGQFAEAAQNLLTTQPWASEVGTGRAGRLAHFVRYG